MGRKKKESTPPNQSKKTQNVIQFIIGLAILLLLNFVGSFVFQRFDLTEENRYSLTDATKEDLTELNDIVTIKVYLGGELPADFERLQDATREMLDEFRVYADENIQYEFIDPSAKPNQEERRAVYRELSDKGLQYSNIRSRDGDKATEQIIFPGALIIYRGQEYPVQLVKSQRGIPREIMVNNAIQQLEYELMSTVRSVTKSSTKNVYFLRGNSEIPKENLADIFNTLGEFYNVEWKKIEGKLDALKLANALVVAGPDSALAEKDKYMIDQFIMRGGKVLWLVEPVQANMDSIQKNSLTMGLPKDVNLSDQLFKYGIRLNPNFVTDLNSRRIPVVTGMMGNQPQQEFFPWFFAPFGLPANNHPIVNSLDAVRTDFVSSIDFVGNDSIKKTPLLQTSPYTKVLKAPSRISLNVLREAPDKRQYSQGPQVIAALLEGSFESVFKNRIAPAVTKNPEFNFKEKSVPTAMVVVADADIIRNRYNDKTEEYYALGYDRYANTTFANKDFILNALNYLLDDDGLINARGKEFKIRLLDEQKAKREKLNWQITNVVFPILIILIFGVVHHLIRKRLYTKS